MNCAQLQMAVAAARHRFDLIRKQSTELKPYLVLALPGGQMGIDSAPGQILAGFPGMVADSPVKTSALKLLDELESEQTGTLKDELKALCARLEFVDKCQVELRFGELKYEAIWRLQADERADRQLTPQTRASIRIALGTLGHFLKRAARQP